MLKLNNRKPKTTFFETGSMSRWKGSHVRAVCVALERGRMVLKWKGTRQVFSLPYSFILDKAAEAHMLAERRRKAEERAHAKGKEYKPRVSVSRRIGR